jgi:hypothetical protein
MKYFILSAVAVFSSLILHAQKYPQPEFSNEVYYLKKDSVNSVIRLEKGSSKMESKTKMGGLGGSEMGYEMSGEKSTVRLNKVNNFSFVFSTGASSGSSSSNAERDSMMKANGMDPSVGQGMPSMSNMTDPANSIALYKVETGKGKRKILLQKSTGAMPFGNKKIKSSDKLTFSVKNVKESYWELVIDKPLSKGEYIFTLTNVMSMNGMNGDLLLFAFGVD